MICAEKQQLLEDYLERAEALAVEAELLLQAIQNGSKEEESAAWVRLERGRIYSDIAHLALVNHVSFHGCDRSAAVSA
jgi:hypothetical protein